MTGPVRSRRLGGESDRPDQAPGLADLRHVQLKQGNIAQALATWNAFLDCADGVHSVRIDDGISNTRARLPQIKDTTAVQELEERITSRRGSPA